MNHTKKQNKIHHYLILTLRVFCVCIKSIKLLFPLHIINKVALASIPLINTYCISQIIESLISDVIVSSLVFRYMALFLLLLVLGRIIAVMNNIIESHIYNKIKQNNHLEFNEIINSFSLSYIDSPKGKNDMQLLLVSYEFYHNIYFGIINIFNCSYTFGIAFGILLKFNVWFAIITILLVIPVIIFTYKNQKDENDFDVQQSPIRAVKDNYQNMLTSSHYSMDVRLYNLQRTFLDRFLNYATQIQKDYKNHYKQKAILGSIFQSIMILGQIGLICYLLIITYTGHISAGDLSLYTSYVISVIGIFIIGSQVIIEIITKIMWIDEYSIAKYDNVSSKKTINNIDKKDVLNITSIEFIDVWFKYPGTDSFVLKGVSFQLNKGEKLSIVGINGAGKTTCIKLLLGIYKPTTGKILINNVSIDHFSNTALYRQFSCVFQNYIIYPFSIKDNIQFGYRYNEDDDTILDNVMRQSGCDRFLRNLKNGVDTFLSRKYHSDGIELSKGQQQSVVIARALYKNASVMIFDEPSSALDPERENELLKVFENLNNNQIGIIISHRLSSTKFCDRIIFLDNGVIKENGNHQELMKLDGLYKKMYLTQKNQYGEINE